MKTDQLFHEYFQLVPQALFELLQIKPACPYRFSSPVVKSGERRMDGLLEPVEPDQPYYFLEIQGYLDSSIYWRAVHQIGIYHEQRPKLNGREWRAVFLFLDAGFDPGIETLGPMAGTASDWLIRGVLPDLLGNITAPSPVLNVLRPLVVQNNETIRQELPRWAKSIEQADVLDKRRQNKLLDILVQFIMQRFTELSHKEISKMLNLTPVEETVAGKELIQMGAQRAWRDGIINNLEKRFGTVSELTTAVIEQIEDIDDLKFLHGESVTADSLKAFEHVLAGYARKRR